MIELRVSEPDPIVLEAEEQDQASLAVIEAFVSGGDIPAYTGSYNVTPTQSQQTLETNGKKMVRDVKVAPIPSQYIIPEGTLEVTQNGQQSVREYENVNVNVPAPTGEKTINVSQNGTTTEDVANYATAKVVTNVPASAVDTGTKNINANGTHDVVGYASANVNVPNSYSASDEGKVVQSGALVAQTSDTVTANDTYDTTLINSLTVNVSGGGGGVGSVVTIATERTYAKDVINDMFAGYDPIATDSYLVGMLINKAIADYVDFQILTFFYRANSSSWGCIARYRTTGTTIGYNHQNQIGSTLKGSAAVGDEYEIFAPNYLG